MNVQSDAGSSPRFPQLTVGKAGQGRPNVTSPTPSGGGGGGETDQPNREGATPDPALRMRLGPGCESHVTPPSNLRLPADCACVTSGPRDPRRAGAGTRAAGKMAARVPCRRWGWAAVSFGRQRGPSASLARKPPRAWWLPGQ